MADNGFRPAGWNSKPDSQIPKAQLGTPKGAVSFNPADFDKLILQQGVRVKVYRSMLCPNVKSLDGGEHEIDCKLCNDNGFVDSNPITTMSVIQSQELEKIARAEGYWDGNSVAATFTRGIELQYFTLVELLDFTDIYYERVKRQAGSVDVLKYKACRINVIMDKTGRTYLPDSDYDIDENGSIRWKVDRGPSRGMIYSVHYECAQRFRAIQAMHVNRFVQDGRKSASVTMVKMPEQWKLQKEFLVKRRDKKGNSLSINLIRDPDDDQDSDYNQDTPE